MKGVKMWLGREIFHVIIIAVENRAVVHVNSVKSRKRKWFE